MPSPLHACTHRCPGEGRAHGRPHSSGREHKNAYNVKERAWDLKSEYLGSNAALPLTSKSLNLGNSLYSLCIDA